MKTGMGKFFIPAALFLTISCLSAQSPFSPSGLGRETAVPGGHRGAVNVLIPLEGGLALSAGEDGFLEIWDTRAAEARQRYQLSPYAITAMVKRPGKPQVSLVESDGLGICRISAWDYEDKRNLFSLRFRDPISYIAYSARGSFLIAARSGKTGVVFIDPETGGLLESPGELTGPVSFAATGRSERTMISYAASGVLSYWELESGAEIRRFSVPANLRSPLLFGGGRFFAGFDSRGLLVLDAVSGALLFRRDEIPRGTLLETDSEGSGFACLVPPEGKEGGALYFLSVGGPGALSVQDRLSLPPRGGDALSAAAVGPEAAILGTSSGGVELLPRDGGPGRVMAVNPQDRIREIAASAATLAFLAGGGEPAFIPLDFVELRSGDPVRLGAGGDYRRISSGPEPGAEGGEHFLLWQTLAGRDPPALITVSRSGGPSVPSPVPIPFRGVLRSVAALGDEALFLDSAGTVTVMNLKTGEAVFTFSSVGSLDAAFLDRGNLIVGRSAVSGNSPFLMVNTATGETVPLAYSSAIGARVYRGRGGMVYGAVIDQGLEGAVTALIRIDTVNAALSERLVEYQGEDTLVDLAESGGVLASTLGGDGATLYKSPGVYSFERGPGLPLRLIDGDFCFVVLDGEGNIAWHDPDTGKLLALFRIYGDRWIMETRGPLREGPVIRGATGAFNG